MHWGPSGIKVWDLHIPWRHVLCVILLSDASAVNTTVVTSHWLPSTCRIHSGHLARAVTSQSCLLPPALSPFWPVFVFLVPLELFRLHLSQGLCSCCFSAFGSLPNASSAEVSCYTSDNPTALLLLILESALWNSYLFEFIVCILFTFNVLAFYLSLWPPQYLGSFYTPAAKIVLSTT